MHCELSGVCAFHREVLVDYEITGNNLLSHHLPGMRCHWLFVGEKHRMSGKSERESPWFKYGSDAKYRAWIQTQPSALSGQQDYCDDGIMRCEAAHFRTAATSGTGFKAPYSCIPLTHDEHQLQHGQGASELGDKEWWWHQVDHHLRKWAQGKLKKTVMDF